MDELLEALVVEEFQPCLTLKEVLQDKLTASDVIDCCKGLIIYEKSSDMVRFIHFTIQKFIEINANNFLPPATHLAKTCLIFLASPEFDEPSPDNRVMPPYVPPKLKFSRFREWPPQLFPYHFAEYAAKFWAVHTRGEAESCFDIQQAFVCFFARSSKAAIVHATANVSFS